MVIKVEGVTPVHEVSVDPQPSGVWAPVLRLKALELALIGNHANWNADAVIVRAKAFEDYLTHGAEAQPEPLPSVQEQITTAFLNLTGNLDAVTGL